MTTYITLDHQLDPLSLQRNDSSTQLERRVPIHRRLLSHSLQDGKVHREGGGDCSVERC